MRTPTDLELLQALLKRERDAHPSAKPMTLLTDLRLLGLGGGEDYALMKATRLQMRRMKKEGRVSLDYQSYSLTDSGRKEAQGKD